MKKVYDGPVITFFQNGEMDIIQTSNFIDYTDLNGEVIIYP